ncbi:MAG: hypothetical protein ACI9W6_002711 [Motiliproteus sp.]
MLSAESPEARSPPRLCALSDRFKNQDHSWQDFEHLAAV